MIKGLYYILVAGVAIGLVAACGGAAAPTAPPKAPAPLAPAATPTPARAGEPTPTIRSLAPTPAAAPTPTPPPRARAGRLNVVSSALADDTLDPARMTARASNKTMDLIYGALMFPTIPGKPGPSVAASWNISPDGKTWTFKLRNDVKFHNGDSLTAEDVKFTVDRVARLKFGYGLGFASFFDRSEVVDPYTVTIATKNVYPALGEDYLGGYGPVIYIVPKKYIEAGGDDILTKKPLGSGPFRFKDRQILQFVQYETFEGWWGGPPDFKELFLRQVPDETTRMAVLKTREADIVEGLGGKNVLEAQKSPGLRVYTEEAAALVFMTLAGYKDPASPLSDVRVRRALNLAIDRKSIVDNVLLGLAVPARTVFHPGSNGNDPNLPDPYPYDPDKARALLKEAGFGAGLKLGDIPNLGGTIAPAYLAMIDMWRRVGVDARIIPIEIATMLAGVRERTYKNAFTFSWTFEPNSGRMAVNAFSNQAAFFQATDEIIEDLAAKQAVELNTDKRIAQLRQINLRLLDQAYVVPLYFTNLYTGLTDRVVSWEKPKGYPLTGAYWTARLKD